MINTTYLLLALAFALSVLFVAFKSEVQNLVNKSLTSFRKKESKFLEVTKAISAEIKLLPLLQKVIETATEILEADRSTLFLYDSQTNELWSQIAEGLDVKEIRFPANIGIAGSVFSTGETINIQEAYKDNRFNQAVDIKTGYRTHTILCMQVCNKEGTPIGVIQVLNKNEGFFTETDEARLRAFSAQAAIAIENAQLFKEVIQIKNYNEAMIESMANGVLSVNTMGQILRINSAGKRILELDHESNRIYSASEIFSGQNAWVLDCVQNVLETGQNDEAREVELQLQGSAQVANVNIKFHVLRHIDQRIMGALIVLEDLSYINRLRNTIARYMNKELMDKVLDEGERHLGGTLQKATILNSSIFNFTDLSERIGPQATISLLNEYFELMFDCIHDNQGILDKCIGDSLMAVFGIPFEDKTDTDRALSCAIAMANAVNRFNSELQERRMATIQIGMALNMGKVIVGNIGISKRMNYTVIGKTVDMSVSIQKMTSEYRTSLVIPRHMANDISGNRPMREIDRIHFKGQKETISVYEVIEALPLARQKIVEDNTITFYGALQLYRSKAWAQAQKAFHGILESDPGDTVSQMYIQRCQYFSTHPPPSDWNGTWFVENP